MSKIVKHSGEIIKQAMRARGMTQVELAKLIGKDQTLISRYVSGRIEISEGVARAIAEVLGINFDELRQQLRRDKLERKKEHLSVEFKEVLPGEGKIDISASDEIAHVGHVGRVDTADMMVVPLLDSFPADGNYHLKAKSESYILPPGLHIDTEKSFALKICGDDMTYDEFRDGDIIVIETSAEVKDDDIALIILDGKPALRKIYRTGNNFVLQSSSRDKPVFAKKGDFRIIGRLVLYTRFLVSS